jgi:exonuclease VII large subunit
MKDGHAVTSYEQLAEGDTIETVFAKGTVRSVVEKKQDSNR